ncbi:MAG TPA: hypothetical protein VGM39_19805 [Kofleriaceae bacterium]|jgi:hypothetical protein
MPTDVTAERKPDSQTNTVAADAPLEAAVPGTTFNIGGPLPPVATPSASTYGPPAPAASASTRAFDDQRVLPIPQPRGADPTTTVKPAISRSGTTTTGSVTATEMLNTNWSLREAATARVPDSGPAAVSGTLGATYTNGNTKVDGSVTRNQDSTAVNVTGSEQPAPGLRVTERAGVTIPDRGRAQGTVGVSETYTSGNVVESAGVDVGVGAQNTVRANAAVDGQIGNNLYAGAFGSYGYREGKQDTASLGGSLTAVMPDEREALTVAGVLDQNGALEVRVQFDVFKQRVDSVQGLTDQRKDALVSLFLSFRSDNGNRLLDDRMGGPPQGLETGPSQSVVGGLRIKF